VLRHSSFEGRPGALFTVWPHDGPCERLRVEQRYAFGRQGSSSSAVTPAIICGILDERFYRIDRVGPHQALGRYPLHTIDRRTPIGAQLTDNWNDARYPAPRNEMGRQDVLCFSVSIVPNEFSHV
jgi:hypothetical protein